MPVSNELKRRAATEARNISNPAAFAQRLRNLGPNVSGFEVLVASMLIDLLSETAMDNHQKAFELEYRPTGAAEGAEPTDAERYQWLRNNSAAQWEHPLVCTQQRTEHGMRYVGPLTGNALDAAIDAARAAQKG